MMCFVSNMEKSVYFYRDVLGLELVISSPYWSSFKIGESGQIGLHPVGPDHELPCGLYGRGWFLGLETDSIVQIQQKLGDAVRSEPHQTPTGVVLDSVDPDGNTLQFFQKGAKVDDL